MRKILPIVIFLICFGCRKSNTDLTPFKLDNPSIIKMYCNLSPTSEMSRIENTYSNDNLVNTAYYIQNEKQSEVKYDYDSDNRLTHENTRSKYNRTEKEYQYDTENQLINIQYTFLTYDDAGNELNKSTVDTPLEYQQGKLIKAWESWGGYSTYTYENNQIDTKIDYTGTGTKHHITSYNYDGALVKKEKKVTAEGHLIYERAFQYDFKNRLVKIIENGEIVEENTYRDSQLIEKRTYYFGIDPGFSPCLGNYIYKYAY